LTLLSTVSVDSPSTQLNNIRSSPTTTMNPKESLSSPLRVSSELGYQSEHDTLFGLRKEARSRRPSYVTIILVLALLGSNGAWLWSRKHSFPPSSHHQSQSKWSAHRSRLSIRADSNFKLKGGPSCVRSTGTLHSLVRTRQRQTRCGKVCFQVSLHS
jgi:hypothetical protein